MLENVHRWRYKNCTRIEGSQFEARDDNIFGPNYSRLVNNCIFPFTTYKRLWVCCVSVCNTFFCLLRVSATDDSPPAYSFKQDESINSQKVSQKKW